jgi:hypothetical protein
MIITDERLKSRLEKVIELLDQGKFLIDLRRELPLGTNQLVDSLEYSRERDELGRYYDYETPWGKFSFEGDRYDYLLVLRKGVLPAEFLPQPRLSLATATLHPGYATILSGEESFEIDFQTRDNLDYGSLRLLNQTLAEENIPVVVWKLEEDETKKPPIIRITNDSAMVFASSAIWSPEDQQLVAAQIVTTHQDLLKAIKASLAKNNAKEYLTVKTPQDSTYLKTARRGYVSVSSNLTQANAEGTVTALLHPLSGDPQTHPGEYFYLVVAPYEDLEQKFCERLDLAIPWPIQTSWVKYLLEAGQDQDLVQVLPSCGDDFTTGLRISKNETQWQSVIAYGLRQGQITIE